MSSDIYNNIIKTKLKRRNLYVDNISGGSYGFYKIIKMILRITGIILVSNDNKLTADPKSFFIFDSIGLLFDFLQIFKKIYFDTRLDICSDKKDRIIYNLKNKISNFFKCTIDGFSNRTFISFGHIFYYLIKIIVGIIELDSNSKKKLDDDSDKNKIDSDRNRILYSFILNILLFMIILMYVILELNTVKKTTQNKILFYTLVLITVFVLIYVLLCFTHYLSSKYKNPLTILELIKISILLLYYLVSCITIYNKKIK